MAIATFAALVMAAMLLRSRAEQKRLPSIISMPEKDGYTFQKNSADILPPFRQRLMEKAVPQIVASAQANEAQVIEVVGHTDQQPYDARVRGRSNLDEVLMSTLRGERSEKPRAMDNAGLGMARAIAVAAVLRQVPQLKNFEIIPLSAGPFQRTDDRLTDGSGPNSDPDRRRIVIRIRKHFAKGEEISAK